MIHIGQENTTLIYKLTAFVLRVMSSLDRCM